MAFNGKYEIESEKNYDEFMKRLGEWGPKYTFPGLVCENQHWSGTSFPHLLSTPLCQAVGLLRTIKTLTLKHLGNISISNLLSENSRPREVATSPRSHS